MLPSPTLVDPETAVWMLRDADSNVHAALTSWGIALSAFAMLRVPREVLLGCLIVAGATIGLAATVEMAPGQAIGSARAPEIVAVRGQAMAPFRGPHSPARERPH